MFLLYSIEDPNASIEKVKSFAIIVIGCVLLGCKEFPDDIPHEHDGALTVNGVSYALDSGFVNPTSSNPLRFKLSNGQRVIETVNGETYPTGLDGTVEIDIQVEGTNLTKSTSGEFPYLGPWVENGLYQSIPVPFHVSIVHIKLNGIEYNLHYAKEATATHQWVSGVVNLQSNGQDGYEIDFHFVGENDGDELVINGHFSGNPLPGCCCYCWSDLYP